MKKIIALFTVTFLLGCNWGNNKCSDCSCDKGCCSSGVCSVDDCSCPCKD